MPEYPWLIYRMSEGPLTTKEVHQGVNEQLNRKLGTDWGYSEYEWADLLQGFRPLPIRTASGTIAHFEDGADDVPCVSVVANIVPIQSGTGTPSPSNPRPISGTDELNVVNVSDYANEFRGLYLGTHAFVNLGTLSWYLGSQGYWYCMPEGAKSGTKNWGCYPYYLKPDSVAWANMDDFMAAFGGTQFRLKNSAFDGNTGAQTREALDGVYLIYELDTPTTPTITQQEFEMLCTAFNISGSTYTFDLGQEIMGGTADVVGGTGTKTHGSVDLGSLTWTYHSASGQYSDFFDCYLPNDSIVGTASVAFDGYFEIYKSIPSANIALSGYDDGVMALASGTRRFIVCDKRFTSAEALKTALNGKMLAYPLATPTEYTFTGQQINSLLGVNNVWTDSGEVLDVEYRSNF